MSTLAATPRSVLRERRDDVVGVLRQFGVTRAGVFGSAARREDTANSDIDLIVDFAPGVERDLIRLGEQLSAVTGIPVDVVDVQTVYRRARETGIGTSILRDTVPL